MKYLVNATAGVSTNLDADNLRGEPRWERNVISALLSQGQQVHTTKQFWASSNPLPNNLYPGFNPEWSNNSVLITHGIGKATHILAEAKYYIIQFHEEPNLETAAEFLSYDTKNPGCIIATTDSLNPVTYGAIQKRLGSDKVFHLYGPMVPCVDMEADNWRKPYLTWIYRNFWSFLEDQPNDIDRLFKQLTSVLDKEPATRIKIMIGVWDQWKIGLFPSRETLLDWIGGYPVIAKYKYLWDRIDLLCNIHWYEILNLLKETRYIISPAEPLGCPAYEAAMYGIPTIVNEDVNVFMTGRHTTAFPEVLSSRRAVTDSFLNCLDTMQTNHNYYRKYGDAYRNFVGQHATYKAYVEKLMSIGSQRGWQ